MKWISKKNEISWNTQIQRGLALKSSRDDLKVAFVVVGATTFTQRLTEFRRLETRRRQKITFDQSERSAGQTERFTARWLVHDFVAILVVRRAARCRRCAARATAVVPSLGRLQLSRPRGCCYCYTGARAVVRSCAAAVTVEAGLRFKWRAQTAESWRRDYSCYCYSMLHWHLDWTPQTQIHAVLQTLCLVWAFDLRYMLILFRYLPTLHCN